MRLFILFAFLNRSSVVRSRAFRDRTTCTQRTDCSRFYQIGSAAVGAGTEAAFSARSVRPGCRAYPQWVAGGQYQIMTKRGLSKTIAILHRPRDSWRFE
jgi:hypothetical protein